VDVGSIEPRPVWRETVEPGGTPGSTGEDKLRSYGAAHRELMLSVSPLTDNLTTPQCQFFLWRTITTGHGA
jgi:hypothetical protein